ncbi:MAG: hypothetical protein E7668_00020 [Ruminococcaceae bacterium]|nr:hypothetical protein [Oscillospiraceae bacterium]
MKKSYLKRSMAFLLALLMSVFCFVGCSSMGKTMMKLEDAKLSVNMFQLFLSRTKGTLASSYSYGSKALKDSFWDTVMSTDGATYNRYYTDLVLNNAKTYLEALYVFDQKGLELPDSYIEEIDTKLEQLIEQDANGSKAELNELLAEFGANYKILREAYILEAKFRYLADHMYGADGSLIAENLIEDYYQSTYARFKQVFLYTYDFVYETDEYGEDIYYTDGGRIAYDTTANKRTDNDGKVVHDANGDVIYITRNEKGETRIAYDTKNGTRKHKNAEDGSALVSDLTGERLQEVIDQANLINEKVKEGDFAAFEELVAQYSLDEGMKKYPNGYYLTAQTEYDSPEVVEKLFELEVGQSATVKSDYGIHIIMRYELEEEGYTLSENEDFFISTTTGGYVFMNDLKNYLLTEYLATFESMIVIDEAVLAEADMKSIGANFYY